MRKLLIISTNPGSLISFKGDLIKKLAKKKIKSVHTMLRFK